MIKDKRIHCIEWVDSYDLGDNGWESIRNLKKPQKLVCVSVGYILKETKESIMIAPHISDITNKKCLGTARGLLVIPKVSIIKRRKVK